MGVQCVWFKSFSPLKIICFFINFKFSSDDWTTQQAVFNNPKKFKYNWANKWFHAETIFPVTKLLSTNMLHYLLSAYHVCITIYQYCTTSAHTIYVYIKVITFSLRQDGSNYMKWELQFSYTYIFIVYIQILVKNNCLN